MTKKIASMKEANAAIARAFRESEKDRAKAEHAHAQTEQRLVESLQAQEALKDENRMLTRQIQELSEEVSSSRNYIDKLLLTAQAEKEEEWDMLENKYKSMIRKLQQQIKSQEGTVSLELYRQAIQDGKTKNQELQAKSSQIVSLQAKIDQQSKALASAAERVQKAMTSPTSDHMEQGLYQLHPRMSSPTFTSPQTIPRRLGLTPKTEQSPKLFASKSSPPDIEMQQNEKVHGSVKQQSFAPFTAYKEVPKSSRKEKAKESRTRNQQNHNVNGTQARDAYMLRGKQLRTLMSTQMAPKRGTQAPVVPTESIQRQGEAASTKPSRNAMQQKADDILDWVDQYVESSQKENRDSRLIGDIEQKYAPNEKQFLNQLIPTAKSNPKSNLGPAGKPAKKTIKVSSESKQKAVAERRKVVNNFRKHRAAAFSPPPAKQSMSNKTRKPHPLRHIQMEANIGDHQSAVKPSNNKTSLGKMSQSNTHGPIGVKHDENCIPRSVNQETETPLQNNKSKGRASIRISKVRAAGGRKGLQEKLAQMRSPPALRKSVPLHRLQ